MNLEINITVKKDKGYNIKPLAEAVIEADALSFADMDIRTLASIAAGNIISALAGGTPEVPDPKPEMPPTPFDEDEPPRPSTTSENF